MNIIYIHTHDTGRVVSPYGYGVDTPNYQNFAEDSLLFQQAYSVAPTCSPSRASLLTGVYPHQNGMLGLAQRGFKLEKDMHLASILNKKGFKTALCGVQHEVGYYTDHSLAVKELGYDEDLSSDNSIYEEKDLVYWDQENAKNLVKWLGNYDQEVPFFVSYGMHSTHREFPENDNNFEDYSQPPMNLPNNEITRKDFNKYKKSVSMADDNLGIVLEELKRSGLYDKTIIILTTDHGLAYPFEKCTLNDSGLGVLLSIRVPNAIYKKKSYDGLVSQIDIFPTICDLVNIEKPDYLEGKSFSKLFSGEKIEVNDAIFGEINFHTSYEPVRSVRTKRYKYIRFFDKTYLKINKSNVDDSIVKEFYEENGLENIQKEEEYLFDLYYDAFEKDNLIDKKSYQNVLETMKSKLQEFMQKTADPLLNGPIKIEKGWKVNKRECYTAKTKDVNNYESSEEEGK